MNRRLTISVLVVGTALAAGCGQRLLDFYNDHDDAGLTDMNRAHDLAGRDMSVGDMAVADMSGVVPVDMARAPVVDLEVPEDLEPECLALDLPGSGSIVTAGPATTDFYTPVGALTVEAWVYQTSQAADAVIVAHTGNAGGTLGYYLSTNTSGDLVFSYSADGTTYSTATSTSAVPTGQWAHVAGELILGTGPTPVNTFSLWINGANVTPLLPLAPNAATTPINEPLSIGSFTAATSATPTSFVGYMHDVRISDVDRYSSTFTPQVTLATDGDTLALFHLEDAIGSLSLLDSSSHKINAAPATGAAIGRPPVCQ